MEESVPTCTFSGERALAFIGISKGPLTLKVTFTGALQKKQHKFLAAQLHRTFQGSVITLKTGRK